MENEIKEVIWTTGEIKTPPFSSDARREAGKLLRLLQGGEILSMPTSRPMPTIGSGCHELRIRSADQNWRILYHIGKDVVVLGVFAKKTPKTPESEIKNAKEQLRRYKEGA